MSENQEAVGQAASDPASDPEGTKEIFTASDPESPKWVFMMGWCMARSLPPADPGVWRQAEKAWEQHDPVNEHPDPAISGELVRPPRQYLLSKMADLKDAVVDLLEISERKDVEIEELKAELAWRKAPDDDSGPDRELTGVL